MVQNLFQAAGSTDDKPTRYAPLFTNRFFLGLSTNRNPLRSPAGVIYENHYRIGGVDALIAGQNVEISPRLTIARRPGTTAGLTGVLSSANIPDIPLSFYSFHEITGSVRVFADTASQSFLITSSAVVPIFTKAAGAGQSFYQGVGQALFFSDAKEQQKWLDFGAGSPGNSLAAITATALTNNVATITAANNFAVGQTVVISGTANGGGVLNGTFVVTSANSAQFQFSLTNANITSAADTGFASGTWNWQPAAPTSAPTLNVVASGAAAPAWQANTYFSTMGLLVDNNNNVQQLISVNALGNNTTQFGTSGSGAPQWNATPGGTTTDNTVTWTNWGPITMWKPNTLYSNHRTGGTIVNPCYVYDPVTDTLWGNDTAGGASATSGGTKPNFSPGSKFIADGGIQSWIQVFYPLTVTQFIALNGPSPIWKPSQLYSPAYTSSFRNYGVFVFEPVTPTKAGLPTNQTIFAQVATTAGTSGAAGSQVFQNTSAGAQTVDNQLIWLNLGPSGWQANTNYSAWSGTQPVFSVVKDTNGNLQVCVQTGKSGGTQPQPQWVANKAYVLNDVIVDTNGRLQTVTTAGTSGNTKTLTTSDITSKVTTYTTSVAHGYAVGQQVTVTGSTHNAAFNVTNAIIRSTPTATTFTIDSPHDNIASAGDTGTARAGPTWASVGTTNDGTVVWTAGGTTNGWGFNYGAQTVDGTVKWSCVGPGITWEASTSYHMPSGGWVPPTLGFGGSQIVSGGFVQSPTGTSGFTGMSGKSAGSAPVFSGVAGNFTLDNTIVWQNIAAFSQNSIAWQTGYGYVFAYKARSTSDAFAPAPAGGGQNPPGSGIGLNPAWSNSSVPGLAPSGSADGSVSTASPFSFTAIGPNTGSVVNLSGPGSTDPQVDTVVIFRTTDGGATFFELTEIRNPQPIGGVAQTWQFQDFLPDRASSLFPGLNTLVLAPTGHSNDPPPAGLINIVQHFGRIWGSVGATVFASMGPLVGGANQPPGNPYTAFNPSQVFSFPSPVTKLVPTTTALLVFTTSDLFYIAGGPNILTMFPNILIPGLGLTSFNALTVEGGLIFLVTADNQCVSIDPNMGVSEIGFPIGDKVNQISPSAAYVSFHIQGSFDKALYVADGSTGWFRCNPHQAPDSAISGPVWSPKANVVGGCKAIASLEVAPGVHALLIGATQANKPVLVRDSGYAVFSDNGQPYQADFTFGSIVLAQPGQLAELGFVTCEFVKVGTSPKFSVLLDETSGAFEDLSGYKFTATGLPPQDPPLVYGATLQPATIFANRYYFAQSVGGVIPPQGTSCRHMQMKIDFGTDTVQNELLTLTIFGRHWQEL